MSSVFRNVALSSSKTSKTAASASKTLPAPRKPTSLALTLQKLTPPVPLRESVKKVVLVYNKDAHASARHFAKNIYPRIAYSNRNIDFTVTSIPKPPTPDAQEPEWVLTFEDGQEKRLNLPVKENAEGILKRLVDEVGAVSFSKVAKSQAEEGTKR